MGVEVGRLKEYIDKMQGLYDVVRIVKPGSCHSINVDENGSATTESELCYTLWGRCERCSNCISFQACARNRVQEKTEIKDGKECHVIAIPAPVIENGQKCNSYAIELISIGREVIVSSEEYEAACADNNEDALYVSIVGNKTVSDEIISLAMLDSEMGLICMDSENNCIYSNKRAFKMFHIPNELSRMQEFLRSWVVYSHRHAVSNVWSQFYSYEGQEYLYEIHLMPAIDERTKELIGTCIVVMDITYEAVNTGGIKYRETHDSLTGIFNQEGFNKAVRAVVSEHPEEKYYMICSNIKQFKLVNQLFGMEKGDELLKTTARNLEKWCKGDDVYGRTHSDEFVLFMKKSNFDEKRFRDGVHETAVLLDNSVFRLRFQLGIYEVESIYLPVNDMLDKARMAIDTLTLNNKELAIAFYDEELMKHTLQENEIINNFSAALENGEFHIFLQPQVDCNGKVIAGEALARWIHPEKGIIPPGKFIGVLENANLIYKMDRYVWELAARQLRDWKGTENENYRISVNISPKDLQFLDIEVVFTELVEQYDIDPGKLNLEITETAIAGNIGNVIEMMDRLRQKGFMVEMDDFGSGYSSLNLLKDFKVDVLKIDMKFLDSKEDSGRARIILQHIVNLAKALEMTTIAEGVETAQQLEMLKDMGCDYFQGYYFSKPVSVGEFEDYKGFITK